MLKSFLSMPKHAVDQANMVLRCVIRSCLAYGHEQLVGLVLDAIRQDSRDPTLSFIRCTAYSHSEAC